jgi:FlaA1/EpsC-like NDP-sugar epimerase
MNICDIATAVDANAEQVEIGIRPGEKLHEQMIGVEDAHFTYEYPEHFKILPQICEWGKIDKMIKGGKRVPEGFSYTSDNNPEWMAIPQLQKWIEDNKHKVGNI